MHDHTRPPVNSEGQPSCGNCHRYFNVGRDQPTWAAGTHYCPPCYAAYWDGEDPEDVYLQELRLRPLPDDPPPREDLFDIPEEEREAFIDLVFAACGRRRYR